MPKIHKDNSIIKSICYQIADYASTKRGIRPILVGAGTTLSDDLSPVDNSQVPAYNYIPMPLSVDSAIKIINKWTNQINESQNLKMFLRDIGVIPRWLTLMRQYILKPLHDNFKNIETNIENVIGIYNDILSSVLKQDTTEIGKTNVIEQTIRNYEVLITQDTTQIEKLIVDYFTERNVSWEDLYGKNSLRELARTGLMFIKSTHSSIKLMKIYFPSIILHILATILEKKRNKSSEILFYNTKKHH